MASWSDTLPSSELTCEGRIWHTSDQWIGGIFSAVYTGIAALVTLWSNHKRYPLPTTAAYFLYTIMSGCQVASLFGEFVVAQAAQYAAWGLLYTAIFIVIIIEGERYWVRALGALFLAAYASVSIGAVIYLGIINQWATIVLTVFPFFILGIMLLTWAIYPPPRHAHSAGLRWFIFLLFVSGSLAIVFWAIDNWACDDKTKVWPFVLAWFFALYFHIELIKYLTHLYSKYVPDGAEYSFAAGWFLSHLTGGSSGGSYSAFRQADAIVAATTPNGVILGAVSASTSTTNGSAFNFGS